MAETSLHLATQASRVFLVHTREAPACLPTPNALSEEVRRVGDVSATNFWYELYSKIL